MHVHGKTLKKLTIKKKRFITKHARITINDILVKILTGFFPLCIAIAFKYEIEKSIIKEMEKAFLQF